MRFTDKDISDQFCVPEEIHVEGIEVFLEEFRKRCGSVFGETAYVGKEDISVIISREI